MAVPGHRVRVGRERPARCLRAIRAGAPRLPPGPGLRRGVQLELLGARDRPDGDVPHPAVPGRTAAVAAVALGGPAGRARHRRCDARGDIVARQPRRARIPEPAESVRPRRRRRDRAGAPLRTAPVADRHPAQRCGAGRAVSPLDRAGALADEVARFRGRRRRVPLSPGDGVRALERHHRRARRHLGRGHPERGGALLRPDPGGVRGSPS